MPVKYIVITSDGYRHLMPEFAERFNRYASRSVGVTCLCYQLPTILPENFSVVSLGVQPYGKDWTSGLIPYFRGFDSEDRVVLMLEDYFIDSGFDVEEIEIAGGMDCDKFDLTCDRARFPHWVSPESGNLILSDQCARYRSSLQAAVWRVGYLRKFLQAYRTPWEFELIGEIEATQDGAKILGTYNGIMRYKNYLKAGIAQMGERRICNARVVGSSPSAGSSGGT